MFGQDWDRAEATIVARDASYSGDGTVATHTFVVDVRRPDGEVFRAPVNEPTIATDFWPPSVGDEVTVLVRDKDRKVKFDKDDDRLSAKAFRAAQQRAFEDTRNQPPGTPGTPWTTSSGLPEGVAEKLASLGITGGVPMQVFTSDSPQAQAALAAFAHLGEPVAKTPEARLAELEALRDRDLLTAEEYAEQRRRILDDI